MEILKKIASVAILVASIVSVSKAQTDSTVRHAFRLSYTDEAQYKYSKAIEDLMKVYDSKSYELNLRLGWLHYSNKKYNESVAFYQKAIALMPMSIEAKMGIVYPLAAQENWNGVIDQYKAILKIDEYNATINYRLALIYYNKADYASSWRYIEKYINLYPFDFDGASLAGWIKYKMGKKDEARVLFEKALLIQPNDATTKAALSMK